MRANYLLMLFSGITIILWGLWGFFGKLALERNMLPVTIFFAEVIVSMLCSILLFIFILPKQSILQLYNTWNIFGLISGAGLALGLLFYYFALSEGQASIVVPLTATYPIVSALLSYALLGERPRWIQWVGIILVVIGAALLLSGPIAKTPQD
jgi:bacterial/archaeal transporter family protein